MPADTPQPARHSVSAIFQRAERVFERRVDQLLQAKRHKAVQAGTPFNARKAKRDARTVAGREKLDALVRRLADLAVVQEAVLGQQATQDVANLLDGAAAVVLGVAALAVREKCCLETSSCSDEEKKDDERTLFAATESVVNFVLEDDFANWDCPKQAA